uniref:Small ribosomal subunit protein uS3m n=1 Tax=Paracoccidioides sp. 'americana' TaxID=2486200 RepID=A0A7H1DNM3_9EURO|nr:ribosomal protein S5 [Paracoccidioides sp. 'americana']
MLNIIKLKLKNINKNTSSVNKKYTDYKSKELVTLLRDWKDSIYTYNKNNLKIIPRLNKISLKLIESYFNSYYLKQKNKARLNKYLTSKYRIFLSNLELRHMNDLVQINVYYYNPKLRLYLKELKKKINFLQRSNKLKSLKRLGNYFILKQRKITQEIILNNFNESKFKSLKVMINLYYNIFIFKTFKLAKLYLFLLQLIYLNKSLFRNNYLQGLVNIIKILYKKNVEFNFINLKYYYLNSSILSQQLILDIKRNRKYLNKNLKSLSKNIPLKNRNEIKIYPNNRYIFHWNLDNKEDLINEVFYALKNKVKSYNLKRIILDEIKYKKVVGIKLQASGRLTRRFTASRSLSKVKILGSIANINSSFYANSSSLLRGRFKSNLDYTNINQHSSLGSFGIKGWLSGY